MFAWMRRSRQRTTAPRRRPTLALAALLSVLIQAFVVQTHIHAWATPLSASYEQDVDASAHAVELSQHDEHQRLCPVCHMQTSTGAAVLSSATAIVDAERGARELTALALSNAPRAITHSWRSRAPPSVL